MFTAIALIFVIFGGFFAWAGWENLVASSTAMHETTGAVIWLISAVNFGTAAVLFCLDRTSNRLLMKIDQINTRFKGHQED